MRKEKIYNESTSREFYDGLYRSLYASGASSIVTESIILRIKNYEAEKDQYIERLEKMCRSYHKGIEEILSAVESIYERS